MIDKLLHQGKKEFKVLEDLKIKETGDANASLCSWDKSFYNNLLKESEYKVDEEVIKEYFPTDHVISETLQIY